MNLKEIKQLVRNLGHAVLIEEDGSGLVVLSLNVYLELIGHPSREEATSQQTHLNANGSSSENELNWRGTSANGMTEQDLLTIEKLNQDIALLKEEIKRRELEELEDGLASETVD